MFSIAMLKKNAFLAQNRENFPVIHVRAIVLFIAKMQKVSITHKK